MSDTTASLSNNNMAPGSGVYAIVLYQDHMCSCQRRLGIAVTKDWEKKVLNLIRL